MNIYIFKSRGRYFIERPDTIDNPIKNLYFFIKNSILIAELEEGIVKAGVKEKYFYLQPKKFENFMSMKEGWSVLRIYNMPPHNPDTQTLISNSIIVLNNGAVENLSDYDDLLETFNVDTVSFSSIVNKLNSL